jgi:hypothetical protein
MPNQAVITASPAAATTVEQTELERKRPERPVIFRLPLTSLAKHPQRETAKQIAASFTRHHEIIIYNWRNTRRGQIGSFVPSGGGGGG